jgi:hypothetical protein
MWTDCYICQGSEKNGSDTKSLSLCHAHTNIIILKITPLPLTSLTVYSSLSDSDVPHTIHCDPTSVLLTLVSFLCLYVFQMPLYSLYIVHTTLWDLVKSNALYRDYGGILGVASVSYDSGIVFIVM